MMSYDPIKDIYISDKVSILYLGFQAALQKFLFYANEEYGSFLIEKEVFS